MKDMRVKDNLTGSSGEKMIKDGPHAPRGQSGCRAILARDDERGPYFRHWTHFNSFYIVYTGNLVDTVKAEMVNGLRKKETWYIMVYRTS